jgi:tRNA threonylcarbamoyladenosine biosynthesis protein TsaE
MKLELRSDSTEETQNIGARLAKILAKGDVLALSGELGAGKTEMVKGIAAGLECDAETSVTSPTYVLIREYPGRLWLYHFDFYRLKTVAEIEGIGYEEYFDGDGVSAVEWADKFPAIFPKRTLWIKLKVTGDSSRNIEFSAESPEHWQKRLESISG